MSVLRVLHLAASPSANTSPDVRSVERFGRRGLTVQTTDQPAASLEYDADNPPDCVVSERSVDETLDCVSVFREHDPQLPVLIFGVPETPAAIRAGVDRGITDYVPQTGGEMQYAMLAHRIETAVSTAGRPKSDLWEMSTSAISQVYEVTNESGLSFEEKLDRVLAIGTNELGYPVGYITRIEDTTVEILASIGGHEDVQPGMTSSLVDNFCQLSVDSDEPVVVSNASTEPALSTASIVSKSGLQCYLGSRIMLDGELYGSLCFADSEPRSSTPVAAQQMTVRVLAQWISYELERNHHQQELERQISRLEEFTNVVSHDLRNPLNIAQGRIELAREERDCPHLESTGKALNRMEAIIEDTLMLARQGKTVSEKTPISISSLVTSCWNVVDTGDAELRVIDDFTVHGDRSRLAHVFENLFRNAVEHSSKPVTIRIGLLDFMYTTTRANTDGTFGFYVEDDGPGVPADRHETVFQPGETTRTEGTGFGLSIVKRIIEAHGWEISLTESFDGGARFEVTNVR